MRNLTYFLILTISLCFIFTSCNNSESIKLNPAEVFNNPIGILDESNDYQKLDRVDANNYIKSTNSFKFANIEFQDFEIQESLDEYKNKTYYLTSRSTDQTTSISIKLVKDQNGNLIISEDKCICESSECSENWGCTASGSGSNCACSSCSSNCKKTSTTGENKALDS